MKLLACIALFLSHTLQWFMVETHNTWWTNDSGDAHSIPLAAELFVALEALAWVRPTSIGLLLLGAW